MKKLTKKEISWILYDAGNSAYSMAITTALFPVYFGMFRAGQATMDLGYFNSLASILIAILAPILGTIADYKDQKKRFFLFFFLLGIITTAGLALVPFGQWPILVIVYILTSLGFAGANIFYDAFLTLFKTIELRFVCLKVFTAFFQYGFIIILKLFKTLRSHLNFRIIQIF